MSRIEHFLNLLRVDDAHQVRIGRAPAIDTRQLDRAEKAREHQPVTRAPAQVTAQVVRVEGPPPGAGALAARDGPRQRRIIIDHTLQ